MLISAPTTNNAPIPMRIHPSPRTRRLRSNLEGGEIPLDCGGGCIRQRLGLADSHGNNHFLSITQNGYVHGSVGNGSSHAHVKLVRRANRDVVEISDNVAALDTE